MPDNQPTAPTFLTRFRGWFVALGPGVITGASDDDPSGIATYSQAGAQTGYGLLWVMIFTLPMMIVIQYVSALIGRVTGAGLAANMKKHYPRWVPLTIVLLMLIANTINIGADISAMGEAASLVLGGHGIIYAVILTAISLALQVFIPYDKYISVLKVLCLVLFAYVAVVFSVGVPWATALKNSVLPQIVFDTSYMTTIIAVLGTTISPYLFFWQASEEAEEETDDPAAHPLREAPQEATKALHRIKIDTVFGMAFSNIIAFFIILSTAVTLHTHGVTDIATASQAAEALRPIAGELTFLLFAIGIIGTGLLAIPVLAGSAAYALAELFNWNIGLGKKPHEAKGFYLALSGVMILGMLIIFLGINPIKALYWAAVINGLAAVPIMIIMMMMSSNQKVMGRFSISKRTKIFGWASTIVMLAAGIGLLATL